MQIYHGRENVLYMTKKGYVYKKTIKIFTSSKIVANWDKAFRPNFGYAEGYEVIFTNKESVMTTFM